jgi:predicted DNA-binding transcriptional regulator AlpA
VGADAIQPEPSSAPRTQPPTISIHDKLAWSLADIAALTGLSRRLLERELSARRMPQPDLRKIGGRRCLWKPSTIRSWLGEGES